jgi:hypothetical protein
MIELHHLTARLARPVLGSKIAGSIPAESVAHPAASGQRSK